jgi:hypothetical protein
MRSGDPGPDRPRARREGPDLTIFATRTVPARGGRDAALFLRFFSFRLRGGSLWSLPLPGLLGNVRFLFGLDLPRRAVPMLLVPAVRLPLGFPKQIGALLDALLLLRVHSTTPQLFPAGKLTLVARGGKMPLPASGARLAGRAPALVGWRIGLFEKGESRCHT